MIRIKALTDRTIAERFHEVKDEETLWGQISDETRLLATRLLQSSLEDEMTRRLAAGSYARTPLRQGWRNGSYHRQIATRWGILDLYMPRARTALPPSEVLGRFQRREPEVDRLLRTAFLRGISTRQVGAVLEPVLGYRPSAQTVSRVSRILDAEVQRFHRRQLHDTFRYLFLDGITMTVKHPGGVRKRLILVAYGIRLDGTRQLVDFLIATSESARQWEGFLTNLYRRGLEGTHLALIATDGCAGLHAALEVVYPRIPHQRCWAHKLRNVAAKLPRSIQKTCLREAKQIYQAPHAQEAGARFRIWAERWRAVAPQAVACLEQDFDHMLVFYRCPPQDWIKVRTTNVIERAFREVRRRTRPMSCFQNMASCERIIYAIMSHLNEDWSKALPVASTQLS